LTAITLSCSSPVYCRACRSSFFFFNDTATTEIYTLSLHDALPIFLRLHLLDHSQADAFGVRVRHAGAQRDVKHEQPRIEELESRSEEHTSELQSLTNLVCRLLLEKKKQINHQRTNISKRQSTT